MVYTDYSFVNVFQYDESDIYWCTADIGWITGHSYIIYGPLLNGATTVMFEGVPTYPDAGRFWQICDKHGVNQFYTAPTAIRALMAHGEDHVKSYGLYALRCWAQWASLLMKRPGSGITFMWERSAAQLWIPGGKRKPVAL